MRLYDSYDYVIIGAGSAGSTIANRLGEDYRLRILILEAGPPDTSFLLKMPAGFASLGEKSRGAHAPGRRSAARRGAPAPLKPPDEGSVERCGHPAAAPAHPATHVEPLPRHPLSRKDGSTRHWVARRSVT